MTNLTALHEAIGRLGVAWGQVSGSAGAADLGAVAGAQLVAVNDAIGVVQRHLAAVHADVAAEIARRSRPESGADSLAKQQGFRSPAKLIAATTGVSVGEAAKLVAVGEATAPRTNLVGERMPAKYPAVRAALTAGRLGPPAAALIIAVLDRCRVAAGHERTAEGERILVEQAAGLALDDVRKLIARAEAWLDPDGVEPRAEEKHAKRSLTISERDGMVHVHAQLDPETAAPVVTAIRGYVSAVFAARAEAIDSDGPDGDRRTIAMLQADALAALCGHMIGCAQQDVPLAGATVIVRVNLTDLDAGSGSGEVDGIDQPVSIGAVRRIAAGGGVIPCVLGGDSEILDWGREKRLFTRAQRLALVERDGGCAMCGLPPQMTKAHHIRWWKRDRGPTDLANGVLLCESCHHRIHDNGWDIQIEGVGAAARVWFLPPVHVDPNRTPRLGGRARFGFGLAA